MTGDLADQAIDKALAVLREEFAGTGWRFGTVWASLAGPGVRRLTASRRAVLLAARDRAEMREKLSREDPDPEEAPRTIPLRQEAARLSPEAGGLVPVNAGDVVHVR